MNLSENVLPDVLPLCHARDMEIMSSLASDPTAVNWPGDLASLDIGQLRDRTNALANYAAARLRPFSEWDASPIDQFEADRALDMWAECRVALHAAVTP